MRKGLILAALGAIILAAATFDYIKPSSVEQNSIQQTQAITDASQLVAQNSLGPAPSSNSQIPIRTSSTTKTTPQSPLINFGLTSTIKPQFVDGGSSDISDQTREQITKMVTRILISENPRVTESYRYDPPYLTAVGKRYVLLTKLHVNYSADDIVVDLKSSSSTDDLWYQYSFKTGNGTVIYINADNIYSYTIDRPSFVELPGAELPPDETYESGDGAGSSQVESHTDTLMTISVFDSAGTRVSDATFALP